MSIPTQPIIEKLTPIFRNVFDDDGLVIEESTTASDVEGWDSLAHIRLMVTIEKAFGIRFTASEIADLENVGGMVELIIKKQVR
ncbi:MAG: acyl carrier protein [Glaciimonas sp.]|nr:acyl carrier protein [Glaciimonas sp.]